MFVDRDRAAAVAVGARDIRGDIKGIVNQPFTHTGWISLGDGTFGIPG